VAVVVAVGSGALERVASVVGLEENVVRPMSRSIEPLVAHERVSQRPKHGSDERFLEPGSAFARSCFPHSFPAGTNLIERRSEVVFVDLVPGVRLGKAVLEVCTREHVVVQSGRDTPRDESGRWERRLGSGTPLSFA